MKLNSSFITYDNGEDHILMDSSSKFAGIAHANATTAFILDCLKTETTKEEIVDKMAAVYDAPREVFERDVDKILDKLRGIGGLDE